MKLGLIWIKAVMDVWLGCIANVLVVDNCSKFRNEIPSTSGCFFLLGSSGKAHTAHNDMQHRPGKSPDISR